MRSSVQYVVSSTFIRAKVDFSIFTPKTSSDLAAWIQGIGSIAAIGAAIWIASRQAKRSDETQVLRRAEKYGELYGPPLAITEATIKSLRSALEEAKSELADGSWGLPNGFYENEKFLLEAFDQVPVHSMPTLPSAQSVLKLRQLLKKAVSQLHFIGWCIQSLDTVKSQHIADFECAIQDLETECAALRSDLVKATRPANENKVKVWTCFLRNKFKPRS
jgi:hypothetical protein